MAVRAVAGTHTCCAPKPSAWSPGTPMSFASSGRPSCQLGKKVDMTLSPALNRVTFSPTLRISPAPSDINTRPSGAGKPPVATIRSWKFRDVAWTAMITSPAPGVGMARSTILMFSKLAGSLMTAVFMCGLLVATVFEAASIDKFSLFFRAKRCESSCSQNQKWKRLFPYANENGGKMCDGVMFWVFVFRAVRSREGRLF